MCGDVGLVEHELVEYNTHPLLASPAGRVWFGCMPLTLCAHTHKCLQMPRVLVDILHQCNAGIASLCSFNPIEFDVLKPWGLVASSGFIPNSASYLIRS